MRVFIDMPRKKITLGDLRKKKKVVINKPAIQKETVKQGGKVEERIIINKPVTKEVEKKPKKEEKQPEKKKKVIINDKPQPNSNKSKSIELHKRLTKEYSLWRQYKPLAIGIHEIMLDKHEEEFSKRVVMMALLNHVKSTKYLKNLVKTNSRYNFYNAGVTGEVTSEQKEIAKKMLKEVYKKRQKKLDKRQQQ